MRWNDAYFSMYSVTMVDSVTWRVCRREPAFLLGLWTFYRGGPCLERFSKAVLEAAKTCLVLLPLGKPMLKNQML